MRPRIKKTVNVQSVIENIDRRVKVYSECIKDRMELYGVSYNDAKRMLELQTKAKMIFKNAN